MILWELILTLRGGGLGPRIWLSFGGNNLNPSGFGFCFSAIMCSFDGRAEGQGSWIWWIVSGGNLISSGFGFIFCAIGRGGQRSWISGSVGGDNFFDIGGGNFNSSAFGSMFFAIFCAIVCLFDGNEMAGEVLLEMGGWREQERVLCF